MENFERRTQKTMKVFFMMLVICFLFLAWDAKQTRASETWEKHYRENVDYTEYFNVSEASIIRWSHLNKDLRPLEKYQYEYRSVRMQHCPCNRWIKVLKNENSAKVLFNETTCSTDAFARGSGQKVSKITHTVLDVKNG